MICNSNSWSRSSGEEEEEEVRSQEVEVEEEKFCWVWRAKLTILVALRNMEHVSACRSIDCCGNMADAMFHYCSDLSFFNFAIDYL